MAFLEKKQPKFPLKEVRYASVRTSSQATLNVSHHSIWHVLIGNYKSRGYGALFDYRNPPCYCMVRTLTNMFFMFHTPPVVIAPGVMTKGGAGENMSGVLRGNPFRFVFLAWASP